MTDDDVLLSPDHLARYEVPGAPAGFAARVMELVATEEDTSPARPLSPRSAARRSRWRQVLAAAVILVVIAGAVVLRRRDSSAGGSRVATARESIALGTRGVAVAEPGTELHWSVDADGDAVVEQPIGTAFYRVERGGSFEVRTPLGTAKVTGTCFSVEVTAMMNPIKRDVMKGALVGATLATLVTVTVYEGSVSLANPRGELHLEPGEAAVVQPGSPPQARTTTAALDPRAKALDDAQARISSLEDQLRQARAGSAASEPEHPKQDEGRYYAPSPETLRDMAAKCWVAYDLPPFGTEKDPVLVDEELASAVGVTAAERDAINRAYRTLHDRDVDAVRRLYMELTGVDADATAVMSLDALEAEIHAKSQPDDEIAARRHYSRERAGLEPTPSPTELAHRPVIERLLRIEAGIGNDAETVAATVIGAKRAHELRAHEGAGWQHAASDYGGCNEHY